MSNTKNPVETQENKVSKKGDLSFVRDELNKVAKLKNEFSTDQFKFVKGLVSTQLTDSELLLFLAFANKLQLNPFTGEIIAIPFGRDTERRVNTIITRNGKRVVAARTGELEGISSEAIYVKKIIEDVPVYKYIDGEMKDSGEKKQVERIDRVRAWEGGSLWGAEATVVRSGHSFTVTVPLKEYNTGKNVWANKPETMIKKVAESQALSAAFPEILGSVYDEAEADSINYKAIPQVEETKPATEAQMETLKSMGIEVTEELTFNEAANLIAEGSRK